MSSVGNTEETSVWNRNNFRGIRKCLENCITFRSRMESYLGGIRVKLMKDIPLRKDLHKGLHWLSKNSDTIYIQRSSGNKDFRMKHLKSQRVVVFKETEGKTVELLQEEDRNHIYVKYANIQVVYLYQIMEDNLREVAKFENPPEQSENNLNSNKSEINVMSSLEGKRVLFIGRGRFLSEVRYPTQQDSLATTGHISFTWDPSSSTEQNRITIIKTAPNCLKMAYADSERTVKLIDCKTRDELRIFEMLHQKTINFLEFSCDNKFLFSGGGDNLIKQISCLSFKVVWVFEFHTMQPQAVIAMPTSPRIISVSSQEVMVINYRSKLLEFQDLTPGNSWVRAEVSRDLGTLFLFNGGSRNLFTLDLRLIMDHRISLAKQTIADLNRIDSFTLNRATGAILAFYSTSMTILKNQGTPAEPKFEEFKVIKFKSPVSSFLNEKGHIRVGCINGESIVCDVEEGSVIEETVIFTRKQLDISGNRFDEGADEMVEKYKALHQIISTKTEGMGRRKTMSAMAGDFLMEKFQNFMPNITPNLSLPGKEEEAAPKYEDIAEAPSSDGNIGETKWEGMYVQEKKEVMMAFEFVKIDTAYLQITAKGFDSEGSFIIEGEIYEGRNFVSMKMSRETDDGHQVERYIEGSLVDGNKKLEGIWSFNSENILDNEGNTFRIFEQKELEVNIKGGLKEEDNSLENSMVKGEEKMSGFLMQNYSEEYLFTVLTDLPSPLLIYDKNNQREVVSIPFKIQKGASALEISDDKKMLAIAGTFRTVYLVLNVDFILNVAVNYSNVEIQNAFTNYMRSPNQKAGLKKSKQMKGGDSKDPKFNFPPGFMVSLEKYHKERIHKIKFISFDQKMVTCGGQRIKVFDIQRLSVETIISTRHRDPITQFIIMEDEKRLLTVSQDKSIILTDMATGREIQILPNTNGSGIVSAYFVEETNKLIVGGSDGEITIRDSFVHKNYLGVNGLVRIEGKDWIEKSNQTPLFRYYLKREPFFIKFKVDFFVVLFTVWENVSLVGLQELLDNAAQLKVVPVLSSYQITAFEMFEVYQPPPIFSELLFYFYFRRMKSLTRSEYQLAEHLISKGLVQYYIQRKGKNILTHFFTGLMIENATCNPSEVYLRGVSLRKFKLSDHLFCDYSGDELYNPIGTTPLKVFRSKIRIENRADWSSQLLLNVFQMFLGFSNLSSYPIEATQQYLIYLKTRTWKFAYIYISIYILECIFVTIQVIWYTRLNSTVKYLLSFIVIALNFITMLSEVIQLSGQGFVEYFTTLGNYIELTQISLTYFFCFLIIFSNFEAGSDDSRLLTYAWQFDVMSLTVMMMFLRLSRIIQYFDQFRSLVLKLNKILEEMIPVSVVLAVFVFGFALIFYIVDVQEGEDSSFIESIGLSWDTAFANYDREDLIKGNITFGFFIYLVSTIALPLVLLNFIIAVMGDTLNNMSKDLLALDSVSKLSVCLDFLFIQAGFVKILRFLVCKWRAKSFGQLFDNSQFLYVIYDDVTPAIKEETGSEIVEANNQMEEEEKEESKENQEEKVLTVEDISQGVTRITFEQITKMRDRLEKKMTTVVSTSSTDLEKGMNARVGRLGERLGDLESHQRIIEQQIKRLEAKVNNAEEKEAVDKWGVPLGYGGKLGFLNKPEDIMKTNKVESKLFKSKI